MQGLSGSLKLRLGFAFAITVGVALGAEPREGPRAVQNPSVGDGGVSAFYVWDKGVPGTPGRLLRQEPVPSELMLASASQGLRLLYTSTDGLDGKTPITGSGDVYFPRGEAPPGGWPVIAWAHGTTGIADVCAPSWTGRTQRDADYLSAWLAQGYVVVATDYQGLGTPGGHPYLAVKPEAFSMLDSVRAARREFPELSNAVVLVGQSQGAHAVLSASLLAKDYAPDLNVKGVVATGVPGMPPFLPETTAPQIPTPRLEGGIFPSIFLLLLVANETMTPPFDSSAAVTERARSALAAVKTGCEFIQAARDAGLTVDNELRIRPEEVLARAAAVIRYPTVRFDHPVFVGTGLADTVTSPEGQYNFVTAACRAGSRVEMHYYAGLDHGGTVNPSLMDSVPFVKSAFAGQPFAGNCTSVAAPIGVR